MDVADPLNTAPCGFLSFGDDGRLARVNETLLEMLGYERSELIGRHIEYIFAVGTRIFYQTHWFPLLRMHGRAEEIFLILRSRSGENIGVLANAVRRERSGASAYDCIVMRVRERQKFEDELLRARRAAEKASAALEVQKAELESANRRLHTQSVELERQRDELQATSEELRLANDELRERTEEAEQLRAAAEKANVAKSRFLTVMSHELRTPLNAIAGYAQLLELGIHGPVTDAQLHVLGRIDRSHRHLLKLINDVLDLARIEAGRVEFVIEDVPLPHIVSAVLPLVEPLVSQKGLAFESLVPEDLVVRADREKTERILLNLLGNAVKFTDAGGRISIGADRVADPHAYAHLHVRDTGVGIPADKLAAVFEPFVQVGESRAESTAKGSGLGLAISRDLARGMGGDLAVVSTPGEGSTFTLTLPLPV